MRFIPLFAFLILVLCIPANAQKLERIDPPFWYVEMENDTLELLVRGSRSLEGEWSVDGEGIHLESAEIASNDLYAYLKLIISDGAPAQVVLLKHKGRKFAEYTLRPRVIRDDGLMGLHGNDVMYLITPDRFANGDPSNDIIEGMQEETLDREDHYKRHGGDIQGIIDHVDHFLDLGVSALWLNPVLENDQPKTSYHGYAITDHYRIDPRFGDNALFQELMDSLHQNDIKMIMDVIYNHFGNRHYLFLDLPDSNWVNSWPEFTKTSYRAPVLNDPYAAPSDRKQFSDGWFDHHMPDMNQRDPHLAAYLIQNTLWWIETYGIDALRIDTYTYPDQKFMGKLNHSVRNEYPEMFIFGETWVHGHQVQAFHTREGSSQDDLHGLMSVTDFQLYFALEKMMRETNGWTEGINRLYYALSADWLYEEPNDLVTFVDNHDIARFYGLVGGDMRKFKMGLAFLMTTRGIPCLYYGTETLMSATHGHGEIREDFPGGWEEDGFEWAQLESENKEFQNWLSTLVHYRRSSCALGMGSLIQYIPREGVYVFFREFGDERVAVIMNYNEEVKSVDLHSFPELSKDRSIGVPVFSENVKLDLSQEVRVPEMGVLILDLK
jgi:glycosidase